MNSDKTSIIASILLPIIVVGGIFLIYQAQKPQTDTQVPEPLYTEEVESVAVPDVQINLAKKYFATLKTDKGDIKIQLEVVNTPITANNFIYLARSGFYTNTVFHRTIKGFMIQGGDPKGDGTGGPGYRFKDEPIVGEYTRGTIAMANAGPDTNGSQFFIMHQDYNLPKNYVIFGKVVEGIETVDAIAEAPTQPNANGEDSSPVQPVKVMNVEIVETD